MYKGFYFTPFEQHINSVIIPASVQSIEASNFQSCKYLSSVAVNCSVPPEITVLVFYNNHADRIISVPSASLNAYKTAQYWSDYADSIIAQ